MSVYVDPIHGKAYANDPWYDAMRGRIVQQHTVTGITDDGWVVRHTRTVLDFGRVPPPTVDPDEAIGVREKLPRHVVEAPRPRQAETHKRKEVQGRVVAYLRQYGPAHAKMIAADLGMNYETILYHVKAHAGTVYHIVDKLRKAAVWGLVGVHNKEAA